MDKIFIDIQTSASSLKTKLHGVSSGLSSVGRQAKSGTGKFKGLNASLRKTNNSFNNMTKDANRAGNSLGRVGGKMKGLGSIFTIGRAMSYGLGLAMSKAIQSTMDMIETANLFSVAMGDMAVETQDLLVNMNKITGLDITNMQNSIGTYNLLARSMGIASEKSQVLSTNTYKLGLDLSSLTNIPINQVMQDLRSGLVGQSETVYKYGIDVTEASLKTEALAQGISKSVRNMSQGEKMALRYAVMIKQTSLAQGDFARTIEQPANQLRILGERFVTLVRSIGSLFIPALTVLLPYLNAVVQVLTRIIDGLATMFGYVKPVITNMANGFSSAGDDVDGVTKSIKKMKAVTTGIDELNLIGSPSSDTGGSGAIVGDMDSEIKGYDNMMGNIKLKADEIAKSFMDMLEPIKKFFTWKAIPAVIIMFREAYEALQIVLEILQPTLGDIAKSFTEWLPEAFLGLIWNITDKLKSFTEWAKEHPKTIEIISNAFAVFFAIWAVGNVLLFLQNLKLLVGVLAPFKAVLGLITGGFKLFGIVVGFLTTPMGLAITAIGLLAFAGWYLYTHFDEIKGKLKTIFEKIGTYISELVKRGKDDFEEFKLIIGRIFDGIKEFILIFIESIKTKFKEFKTAVGIIFDGIKESVSIFIESIKTNFNRLSEFLLGFGETLRGGLSSVFDKVGEIVVGFANNAISNFERFVNFVLDGVNKVIDGFNVMIAGINKIPAIHIDFIDNIDDVKFGRVGGTIKVSDHKSTRGFKPMKQSSFSQEDFRIDSNAFASTMPSAVGFDPYELAESVRRGVIDGMRETEGSQNIEVTISEDAIGNSAVSSINKSSRKLGRSVLTL